MPVSHIRTRTYLLTSMINEYVYLCWHFYCWTAVWVLYAYLIIQCMCLFSWLRAGWFCYSYKCDKFWWHTVQYHTIHMGIYYRLQIYHSQTLYDITLTEVQSWWSFELRKAMYTSTSKAGYGASLMRYLQKKMTTVYWECTVSGGFFYKQLMWSIHTIAIYLLLAWNLVSQTVKVPVI